MTGRLYRDGKYGFIYEDMGGGKLRLRRRGMPSWPDHITTREHLEASGVGPLIEVTPDNYRPLETTE